MMMIGSDILYKFDVEFSRIRYIRAMCFELLSIWVKSKLTLNYSDRSDFVLTLKHEIGHGPVRKILRQD